MTFDAEGSFADCCAIHGGVTMRVSSRFRLLCNFLVAVLLGMFLVAQPLSPAAAAPVATPGAGPVNSPLPSTATPNHGLPEGQAAPPVQIGRASCRERV